MYFLWLLFIIEYSSAKLWPRGVVHYSISSKDYDMHSQDEIISTLQALEKEICVKFFAASANFNSSTDDPILFITNKDKQKGCPSQLYNFMSPVVDMTIGYKCINRKDVAKIIVEMLRASITPFDQKPINSESLSNSFKAAELDKNERLMAPADRNYINGHYHKECMQLSAHAPVIMRRANDFTETIQLDDENKKFYKNMLWPLGVVLYRFCPRIANTKEADTLKYAMTAIEASSCVVFQEIPDGDHQLKSKNYLFFKKSGIDAPALGYKTGLQIIGLYSMVNGVKGHSAHVINNLLRALGIPMMSNRYDRDNYVHINWQKVEKGKEIYLEKLPAAAWIKGISYDFSSATHAPFNYMCGNGCDLGDRTVDPVLDHMWGRALKMGKTVDLSDSDKKVMELLYTSQCNSRYFKNE